MTTNRKKRTIKAGSGPLRFDVLTIFPKMFDSYLQESLFERARKKGILDVKAHDLRAWSTDRHKKVDDKPFGGGPGMVMKVEPIDRALRNLEVEKFGSSTSKLKRGVTSQLRTRVILFSTRGKKLDQKMAARLAGYDRLILICGRYEGVDERVAEHLADEEVSIGDYVLSGGELPALVLIEAVSRFLPGFLGKYESLEAIKGSYPVYTRPEAYKFVPEPRKGTKRPRTAVVPKVLLSGDHAKIEAWRQRKERG